MSFHVLDRLSQVDWDSLRFTVGDKQIEILDVEAWKFKVHEWNTVQTESWFYRWKNQRKTKHNDSESRGSEFLKQEEQDAEHP